MLELWFDFSCPYAYLAAQRVAHLGAQVAWRPMLLGGVFRAIGAGDGPLPSISPAKAAHLRHDLDRWAARLGVPLRTPAAHPMRTVRALRVLLGLPEASWAAAIHAVLAAYWQRGEPITDDAVIRAALRGAGLAEPAIAAAFAAADSEPIKAELHRRTAEAVALGVFGAPAWIARRPGRSPILVWGQDRMRWLEAVLAGWDPDAEPPPGGPRPLAVPRAAAGARVDVYFDVASPFAYLALTQLDALVRSGADVRLVPILLGGLFRDLGQVSVPLLAFPPPKQRYVTAELGRWARWWGVPFAMPPKFPQRTVAAQRLTTLATDVGHAAALRLAQRLSSAMWATGQDLEDPAVLAAALRAAGLPEGWLERAQDPAVKARLAASTSAARAAGVFGVPTLVVGGEQLYWGQDRLELVGEAIAAPAEPRA